MNAARLRLVFAAAAFALWIGWLALLAFTTGKPIVLSRPQFLVANLDILAELEEVDGRPDVQVHVVAVAWTAPDDALVPPNRLAIPNLAFVSHESGWIGPGRYLLPLVRNGNDVRVASIPPSPGYAGGPPRIYPATPTVLEQHRRLRHLPAVPDP